MSFSNGNSNSQDGDPLLGALEEMRRRALEALERRRRRTDLVTVELNPFEDNKLNDLVLVSLSRLTEAIFSALGAGTQWWFDFGYCPGQPIRVEFTPGMLVSGGTGQVLEMLLTLTETVGETGKALESPEAHNLVASLGPLKPNPTSLN